MQIVLQSHHLFHVILNASYTKIISYYITYVQRCIATTRSIIKANTIVTIIPDTMYVTKDLQLEA